MVVSWELTAKAETKVGHGSGNFVVGCTGDLRGSIVTSFGKAPSELLPRKASLQEKGVNTQEEKTGRTQGCSMCSGEEHGHEHIFHWEQEERYWAGTTQPGERGRVTEQ